VNCVVIVYISFIAIRLVDFSELQ